MLGLVALERLHHPETTIDKIIWLMEYAITNTHEKTATIAFTALAILIFIRLTKGELRARYKWNWVYFIPEVLIVVVVSTGMSFRRMRRDIYEASSTFCCHELAGRWGRDSGQDTARRSCMDRISIEALQPEVHEVNHVPLSVRSTLQELPTI